ncbi:MAG: hypothetical protein II062_04915 [Oscillospiraceae bacterium]|nr:hypothetical protein [Oscillospiraceae bacterium]
MAEKIVRGEKKEAAPAQKAAETVKKAAPAAKKAAETAKKPQQTIVTPNKPTGGSTVGLRIGAIVLWVLAIVCEVFAIMAIMQYFIPPFGMSPLVFLIIMIVLDMAFAILAAQLWKKANHIKPMSEKRGKFLFYLWNELGVIMACVCFIPLIILLLKNDKLDKKTKTIAAIVAVVALLITGVASADFHPISAEQKEEAEQQITTDVYWTQFGHKYHLKWSENEGDECCPYVRESSTVYKGSVTEAIESGRTAICSYCASHYAEEMGLTLENLNVEDKDAVAPQINVNTGTAPAGTEAK